MRLINWVFKRRDCFSRLGTGPMAASAPFSQAVEAVTNGDESGLRALLAGNAGLVYERAPFRHRASLLHYVAANGVEVQRSPKNALAIARILLEAGAEADAVAPVYGSSDTTLCLTVTSVHPYLAGVQTSLVDVLVDHGAKIDGVAGDGAPLGCALLFGYTQAAERLVLRGARVDNLIYAAGLGPTDVVRYMLAAGTGTDRIVRRTDDRAGRFSFPVARDADAREVALIVAAMHGRLSTVRVLLDGGVDVNATPYCRQSALHYAANMGRAEVVEELLARGANASVVDTQMHQTPAQWAREGGNSAVAERLEGMNG
ncbi:MAG TPA: ankyrin repeat domain-containing protein [Bryobacteraceae bacterium]|nr:ankyrin repeat domain-containing protein [Bryobacteraceae bacterium]